MEDSDEDERCRTWRGKRAFSFDNIPRPVKQSKNALVSTASTGEGCEDVAAVAAVDDELTHGANRDENEVENSDVEALINNFVEVHPMCTSAFNDNEALHLLTKLPPKGKIPEMQVVPRSFDNSMLRPPDEAVGERPCVNDERCCCHWLGKLWHGESDPRTFVCTEYLLPKEQKAWRDGTMRLPECRRKCLFCQRYWLHGIFLRLKSEPDFRANMSGKLLQEFRNEMGTHTCDVETSDGYPKSCLLSINEKDGLSDPVMMFPFVGFNTKHYSFRVDSKGRGYAVQLGMIPRSDLNGRPSTE